MKFSLKLDFHRIARVWLDELLPAMFKPDKILEHLFVPKPSLSTCFCKAAVELLVPKGPIGVYGLLGAELVPNLSGSLRLQVGVSNQKLSHYENSLALRSDSASIGLPQEFADSVLDGAIECLGSNRNLPSGDLVFFCAAAGNVGSNSALFRELGELVPKMILMASSRPDHDELAALLDFRL